MLTHRMMWLYLLMKALKHLGISENFKEDIAEMSRDFARCSQRAIDGYGKRTFFSGDDGKRRRDEAFNELVDFNGAIKKICEASSEVTKLWEKINYIEEYKNWVSPEYKKKIDDSLPRTITGSLLTRVRESKQERKEEKAHE